jgi:hypothetical protein
MSPAFPIELSLTSDLGPPADIEVTTTIGLLSDGGIRVDSTAAGLTDIGESFVGVIVALYRDLGDRSHSLLWTSSPVRYGLAGKWVGRSHVRTSFTQTVGAGVPHQVGYVLVHHYSSPNEATADAQSWLSRLGTALPPISEVMKIPSETPACRPTCATE